MTKKKAPPDAPYLYVLVRRDLPPSHQAVQAIHAAFIAARNLFPAEQTDTPHLVLCGVSDEAALKDAHERLVRANVPVTLYWEPDFGNQMTAMATGPLAGKRRKVMACYRLL